MIVVFNPVAGRRRAHLLWRVLDHLVANGIRVELAETCHVGHAARLARDAVVSGCTLVVAAGGDGTIAEVASGLAGSTARLGVIPLGTANVVAHELGLSFAPRAVAAALAFGRTRLLWPGVAESNGSARLFVQMLGAGFDARVVHRLPCGLKRVAGRGAYVVQSLREMAAYRFSPLQLVIDGASVEASSVVVSKGRLYGGRYLLAPDADPAQPGFTVAVFGLGGALPALLYGAALPLNLLPRAPGVRHLRAACVEIASSAPVQTDGDPAGIAPIRIHDAAAPIRVVIG